MLYPLIVPSLYLKTSVSTLFWSVLLLVSLFSFVFVFWRPIVALFGLRYEQPVYSDLHPYDCTKVYVISQYVSRVSPSGQTMSFQNAFIRPPHLCPVWLLCLWVWLYVALGLMFLGLKWFYPDLLNGYEKWMRLVSFYYCCLIIPYYLVQTATVHCNNLTSYELLVVLGWNFRWRTSSWNRGVVYLVIIGIIVLVCR